MSIAAPLPVTTSDAAAWVKAVFCWTAATLFAGFYCYIVIDAAVTSIRDDYSGQSATGQSLDPSQLASNTTYFALLYIVLAAIVFGAASIAHGATITRGVRAALGRSFDGRRVRVAGFAGVALLLTALKVAGDVAFIGAQALVPALNGPGGQAPLGQRLVNDIPTTHPLLVDAISSLGAGIGEEVCALAAWVWLAERIGLLTWRPRGWPVGTAAVAVALVTLRLSYHVYLGPHAAFYLPWAIGTTWIYLRTRRLLPIIVSHVLIDFTLGLSRLAHLDWQIWCAGLPAAYALLLWAASSSRNARGPLRGLQSGLRVATEAPQVAMGTAKA